MYQPVNDAGQATSLFSQKFAQPRVETCLYRTDESDDGSSACCELLSRIARTNTARECIVPRKACAACCQSFPPTLDSWNPVIASLLLSVLDSQTTNEASSPSDQHHTASLRQQALICLDVERVNDQRTRPLRIDRDCCFLGQSLPIDPRNSRELTFICHHPSRDRTTREGCRRCRDWSMERGISRPMRLTELVPARGGRCGPPIRSWSVGVVTAPRREATLEWTLDSIVRAGWERPHLFIDGLVRIPQNYLHLPVTWRERAVGAWPNTYLALMEMIQRDPEADAFLLFQDDCCVYDRANLREFLEQSLWPEGQPGIVSLFCPQPYNKTQPGWHLLAEPWVWGAQAFLFSRDVARELVMAHEAFSHRWNGYYGGRIQVDVLIGQWAYHNHKPIWFPNPSLAQHVGNTSSIWEDARVAGLRKADWYAGDLETPCFAENQLGKFPEEHFPCLEAYRESYIRRIDSGGERMRQSRVVLCGLCRDVRHFLPRFAARTVQLGSMFKEYRVVLFENGSIDATREFLDDWQQQNDRITILSDRTQSDRSDQIRSSARAIAMAGYRNRYHQFVTEHYPDFDFVIVVDSDLAGGWSYEGIANTFGHDDWDFVGSSGLQRAGDQYGGDWLQFDAWAFRAIGHPQPHSPQEICRTLFERGEPLVPVLSCFGGLGIYRMAPFMSSRYDGPDMEHVVFHERIRANGFSRVFLNPSQIVLYSPE